MLHILNDRITRFFESFLNVLCTGSTKLLTLGIYSFCRLFLLSWFKWHRVVFLTLVVMTQKNSIQTYKQKTYILNWMVLVHNIVCDGFLLLSWTFRIHNVSFAKLEINVSPFWSFCTNIEVQPYNLILNLSRYALRIQVSSHLEY